MNPSCQSFSFLASWFFLLHNSYQVDASKRDGVISFPSISLSFPDILLKSLCNDDDDNRDKTVSFFPWLKEFVMKWYAFISGQTKHYILHIVSAKKYKEWSVFECLMKRPWLQSLMDLVGYFVQINTTYHMDALMSECMRKNMHIILFAINLRISLSFLVRFCCFDHFIPDW